MFKRLLLIVGISTLLSAAVAAQAAGDWEILEKTNEGYEIARKPLPGSDLPALRGRGVLRGDIHHLLAVLLDWKHATEWAEGASSLKVLRQEGVIPSLLYAYADLTWPVSDRDIVTRSKVVVIAKGEQYKYISNAEPTFVPEQDGVVRIKRSDSYFLLKKQADDKVWVEYVVDVDPGGKLPTFLIKWASKSIPADTLRKLQRQLDKTRGKYDAEIAKLKAL